MAKLNIKLVNLDDMVPRARRKGGKDKAANGGGQIYGGEYEKVKGKGKEYTEDSLREYARGVINERIKFCSEYKKDVDLNKCVCEAIIRWIRLFGKQEHGKSKKLGLLRAKMVEKVFAEMVKEGKIKCDNIMTDS